MGGGSARLSVHRHRPVERIGVLGPRQVACPTHRLERLGNEGGNIEKANPAVKEDWFVNPKTSQEVTFIDFARSEGRFAKHFDNDGNPSETLLHAKQDRLENWHLLQELAGIR